jgi:hypothetical protein
MATTIKTRRAAAPLQTQSRLWLCRPAANHLSVSTDGKAHRGSAREVEQRRARLHRSVGDVGRGRSRRGLPSERRPMHS